MRYEEKSKSLAGQIWPPPGITKHKQPVASKERSRLATSLGASGQPQTQRGVTNASTKRNSEVDGDNTRHGKRATEAVDLGNFKRRKIQPADESHLSRQPSASGPSRHITGAKPPLMKLSPSPAPVRRVAGPFIIEDSDDEDSDDPSSSLRPVTSQQAPTRSVPSSVSNLPGPSFKETQREQSRRLREETLSRKISDNVKQEKHQTSHRDTFFALLEASHSRGSEARPSKQDKSFRLQPSEACEVLPATTPTAGNGKDACDATMQPEVPDLTEVGSSIATHIKHNRTPMANADSANNVGKGYEGSYSTSRQDRLSTALPSLPGSAHFTARARQPHAERDVGPGPSTPSVTAQKAQFNPVKVPPTVDALDVPTSSTAPSVQQTNLRHERSWQGDASWSDLLHSALRESRQQRETEAQKRSEQAAKKQNEERESQRKREQMRLQMQMQQREAKVRRSRLDEVQRASDQAAREAYKRRCKEAEMKRAVLEQEEQLRREEEALAAKRRADREAARAAAKADAALKRNETQKAEDRQRTSRNSDSEVVRDDRLLVEDLGAPSRLSDKPLSQVTRDVFGVQKGQSGSSLASTSPDAAGAPVPTPFNSASGQRAISGQDPSGDPASVRAADATKARPHGRALGEIKQEDALLFRLKSNGYDWPAVVKSFELATGKTRSKDTLQKRYAKVAQALQAADIEEHLAKRLAEGDIDAQRQINGRVRDTPLIAPPPTTTAREARLQESANLYIWKETEGLTWPEIAEWHESATGRSEPRETLRKRYWRMRDNVTAANVSMDIVAKISNGHLYASKHLAERYKLPRCPVRDIRSQVPEPSPVEQTSNEVLPQEIGSVQPTQHPITPPLSFSDYSEQQLADNPNAVPSRPTTGGKTMNVHYAVYLRECQRQAWLQMESEQVQSVAWQDHGDSEDDFSADEHCHYVYRVFRREILAKSPRDTGSLMRHNHLRPENTQHEYDESDDDDGDQDVTNDVVNDDVNRWIECRETYEDLSSANDAAGQEVVRAIPGRTLSTTNGYSLRHELDEYGMAQFILDVSGSGRIEVIVDRLLHTTEERVLPRSRHGEVSTTLYIIKERITPAGLDGTTLAPISERDINNELHSDLGLANYQAIQFWLDKTFKSDSMRLEVRQTERTEMQLNLLEGLEEGQLFEAETTDDAGRLLKVWVDQKRLCGPRNL